MNSRLTNGQEKVIRKIRDGMTLWEISKATKITPQSGELSHMVKALVEKEYLTMSWNDNGDPIYTRS